VHDRIDYRARVDHEWIDPAPAGGDGTGEADRTRADDENGLVRILARIHVRKVADAPDAEGNAQRNMQ
jgi:hypothetical protein